MDNKVILFYSEKCTHSNKALAIIKKNNLSIDKQSIDMLKQIPSFLKVVPTILIQKDSKILEGKDVFEYLNKNTSDSSIQPFFSNEMTGYSDGYSYLDNSSQINHSYEYLNSPSGNMPSGNMPSGNMPSRNMPSGNMPSGNMPSGNVFDSPQSMSQSSQSENDFNKQLERLKNERSQSMPQPIKRT